jgi:hypothetical protein
MNRVGDHIDGIQERVDRYTGIKVVGEEGKA